jgi:hypothetical protein
VTGECFLEAPKIRQNRTSAVQCLPITGLGGQGLVIAFQRRLKCARLPKCVAAIAQRLDQAGIDRQRTGITRQRFVEAPEMRQRDAAVAERFGIARLKPQRPVQVGQRLLGPLQGLEQSTAIT